MENIEFSHVQLSLAREIFVTQNNIILTDRIILQISGRKQISAQTVINGTTVPLLMKALLTVHHSPKKKHNKTMILLKRNS